MSFLRELLKFLFLNALYFILKNYIRIGHPLFEIILFLLFLNEFKWARAYKLRNFDHFCNENISAKSNHIRK